MTTPTTTPQPHPDELLASYALGILAADELRHVETHLPGCARCRGEVQAFQAIAAELPLAIPDSRPPAGLERRVQAITAPRTRANAAAPSLIEKLRHLLLRRALLRPALAMVALLALAAALLWSQRQVAPVLAPEVVFALTGTAAAPEAAAEVVVGSLATEAVFTASGLPQLPADQQYQIWLIVAGERTSGGVFAVDAGGNGRVTISAPAPLASYDACGVTIEPVGGSPGPTGTQVLGSSS